MKLAVLGGGHGSYAAAADLADTGHEVRMWRRAADAFQPVLDSATIELKDQKGTRPVRIAAASRDLEAAVAGVSLIVAPLPATGQAQLAVRLAPYLRDGHVVFIPPGSFGSIVFAQSLRASGNQAEVAFVESGTLPWLARKHGPATVAITTRATTLPTGVFPAHLTDYAVSVVRSAFPEILPVTDSLDAALLNGGPIIHPPLIMMNAGPIAHFPAWDIHKEGTQPAIRAVQDALDEERIAVRRALGYGEPHWRIADHYGVGGKASMYGDLAHDKLIISGDWNEKLDLLTHRYMREDVQIGLALIVSLGRWLGIRMPVAQGLLALASALTHEDLAANGRTVEKLGLSHFSLDTLREALRDGSAAHA